MSFSQLSFLGFLAITFLAWLPLGKTGRKCVLLVASVVFYGAWNVWFLAALAFVWAIVLIVPQLIARCREHRARRSVTALGVAVLLLALAGLKYFGAFTTSGGVAFGTEASSGTTILSRLVLPVGMSFYTFQAISYLVDTYRGVLTPSRSPLDTALYVGFFPFVLAGPIQKAAAWLPQIEAFHPVRLANLRDGCERILLGYLLKIGVADPVAPLVDQVFRAVGSTGAGDLWAGMLLYSLQILADFAGYSLIARGAARCFGYEVQANFEQPYFSRSFSEFWRRWHISLSTWLQQYLFTPLFNAFSRRFGNRHGGATDADLQLAYASAVIPTMLLAGAWHGAGLTFVVWGLYHGLALAFERRFLFGNRPIPKRVRFRGFAQSLRALVNMLAIFLLVSFGWIVFRSDSITAALLFFTRMMSFSGWAVKTAAVHWLVGGFTTLLLIDLVQYLRRDEWAFRSAPLFVRSAVYGAIVVHTVLYAGRGGEVAFIYTQF